MTRCQGIVLLFFTKVAFSCKNGLLFLILTKQLLMEIVNKNAAAKTLPGKNQNVFQNYYSPFGRSCDLSFCTSRFNCETKMPPVSLEDGGKVVGIIYPPPEVRNIVDKTASFVAKNGPEFEQRIKQNEINNPKFNFLNGGDPYHAYYQHKVNEIREGKEPSPPSGTPASAPQSTTEVAIPKQPDVVKQKQSDLLKKVTKVKEPPPPKDPPADFEFIADPPSISAFDLDVVKLTAQFVARNGRQFLTQLMNREQKNYQFDFLRPQHSLFQYFTKLLEQYTKVLIPPKDLMKRLDDVSANEKLVKDDVDYRVRWIKHVEAKKRREEEEAEKERVSYAQIDWHNFVVVETVDYQPWELGNFPPPTNPTEVGARVLMQRRIETNPAPPPAAKPKPAPVQVSAGGEEKGDNTNVEDMEEGSSDSESDEGDSYLSQPPSAIGKPLMAVDAAPAVQQPPTALPNPTNVEVRKYDPKQAKGKVKKVAEDDSFLVSPITGEKVPASKVQEHMRIGLLDPRWVEERDKQITARAVEDHVYAPGTAIESSLKHLAERRTDIFGVGEEAAQEAAIGKKMGEEEKRAGEGDKVAWDGHSSTAEAAARAARANISLNEQIEQIHRNKGLIGDASKEAIGPAKTDPTPGAAAVAPPAPPVPEVAHVPVQAPAIIAAPAAVPVAVGIMPVRAPPPPMMVPQPPQQFYMPQPQAHFGMAPPMPHPMGGDDGPPAAKKARGEDALMNEADFMARNVSPVTFRYVNWVANCKSKY